MLDLYRDLARSQRGHISGARRVWGAALTGAGLVEIAAGLTENLGPSLPRWIEAWKEVSAYLTPGPAIAVYGVSAALLIVGLVLVFKRPRAGSGGSYLEFEPRLLREVSILMPVLAGQSGGYIENRVFEHCQIIGPAVLSLHNCHVINPDPVEKPEGMVWVAPTDTPEGCIFVVNCKFYECTFEFIGLAVSADGVERLRHELRQLPDPSGSTAPGSPPPSSPASS